MASAKPSRPERLVELASQHGLAAPDFARDRNDPAQLGETEQHPREPLAMGVARKREPGVGLELKWRLRRAPTNPDRGGRRDDCDDAWKSAISREITAISGTARDVKW